MAGVSLDGSSPVFADDDLQDILDGFQFIARYELLEGRETYQPGGIVEWHDFYSVYGDWEDGVVLVDLTFNPLSPDQSDLRVGHWYFAASQLPSVYLTGNTYDLSGAAADACRQWAAKLKLKYDFSSADQKLSRSQQTKALLEMADQYEAKQRPMRISQVRQDVT